MLGIHQDAKGWKVLGKERRCNREGDMGETETGTRERRVKPAVHAAGCARLGRYPAAARGS